MHIEEYPYPTNRAWYLLCLGEAHFLRAWFQFDQLQKYGGVAADGKAYGFPLVTKYLTTGDVLDLPRNTYDECVNQILSDCDEAIKYLHFNYVTPGAVAQAGGEEGYGRASGLAALCLKAKVLLYAASPAFNVGSDVEKWRRAAAAAKEVIDKTGFEDLMSLVYYTGHGQRTNINPIVASANYNRDMFFRGNVTVGQRTLELQNFPPRQAGGEALYQPTQNLVDSFPMRDGYPITNSSSDFPYRLDSMYVNRDPRFHAFILYDGHSAANWGIHTPNPATFQMKTGGADAFGTHQNATRTGYYLKKWLNGSVRNTNPQVNTNYAAIIFGRPELYLNFAEAALQATGNPDDKTYGYSAREVLTKVRDRALGEGNDKYLPTVTGKDAFLEVVKNERRIELCFEGHRFWDLRRWSAGKNDMTAINTPVYGIYGSEPVESRQFSSPYFPLPYGELLKAKNLVNNDGW
jgi:hypothetical protein